MGDVVEEAGGRGHWPSAGGKQRLPILGYKIAFLTSACCVRSCLDILIDINIRVKTAVLNVSAGKNFQHNFKKIILFCVVDLGE